MQLQSVELRVADVERTAVPTTGNGRRDESTKWGVSSKDTAHTDLAERAFRWASEKCTATQE